MGAMITQGSVLSRAHSAFNSVEWMYRHQGVMENGNARMCGNHKPMEGNNADFHPDLKRL